MSELVRRKKPEVKLSRRQAIKASLSDTNDLSSSMGDDDYTPNDLSAGMMSEHFSSGDDAPVLKKRKSITETLNKAPKKDHYTPIDTSMVVSTGSTLLDLAISGGRIRGGGCPGGIMIELHGPSGSGKTALAVDIAASIQNKGGEADILDPEARLDKEYARIYGLELDKKNYSQPKLVTEVFNSIYKWDPPNKKVINGKIIDSIAALVSAKEMEDGGDKRGQRKAKDLHEGCRKSSVVLAEGGHKLIIFTNHEMDGEYGKITPGGKAVPYYASLRIRIAQKEKLMPEKKMASGKMVKMVTGVLSLCTVVKNSIDNGFRDAPLYIIYGQGIDDVRANLQWYKQMMNSTKYIACDKEYQRLDFAIKYIEDNDLEGELREDVIDLWEEIQEKFKTTRKKVKVRF